MIPKSLIQPPTGGSSRTWARLLPPECPARNRPNTLAMAFPKHCGARATRSIAAAIPQAPRSPQRSARPPGAAPTSRRSPPGRQPPAPSTPSEPSRASVQGRAPPHPDDSLSQRPGTRTPPGLPQPLPAAVPPRRAPNWSPSRVRPATDVPRANARPPRPPAPIAHPPPPPAHCAVPGRSAPARQPRPFAPPTHHPAAPPRTSRSAMQRRREGDRPAARHQ